MARLQFTFVCYELDHTSPTNYRPNNRTKMKMSNVNLFQDNFVTTSSFRTEEKKIGHRHAIAKSSTNEEGIEGAVLPRKLSGGRVSGKFMKFLGSILPARFACPLYAITVRSSDESLGFVPSTLKPAESLARGG